MDFEVTIVYDNEADTRKYPGLNSGWGFSCLIDTGNEKILFDTGWDGHCLLKNLDILDIDVSGIDILVLSHQHWDHIGGLADVINLNPGMEVFVPASFSANLKQEIAKKGNLHEVTQGCRICDNVLSTGELGDSIKEQSLILNTSKGPFIITGCAHPGLKAIIGSAQEKVRGIMGGLHGSEEYELMEGMELIGAGHCTSHKEHIRERFPNRFLDIKAGLYLKL